MDKKEIIARAGYFRTKAGLSQKALSMDIEMNWGYINRLESKKDFLPSLETLLRIIEACGITEEELLGMPKGAALVTICRRLHLIRGEYK